MNSNFSPGILLRHFKILGLYVMGWSSFSVFFFTHLYPPTPHTAPQTVGVRVWLFRLELGIRPGAPAIELRDQVTYFLGVLMYETDL